MYEEYYGLTEKPFSLTPDPKYLYRSQPHANAFELLQYAIGRREGFVVITGDIGTGKTTLCRALLEQIDRRTFTALVLNPFISEEDLLKRILQDFGVISRDELKAGRMANVTKQELVETLYDFLLSLIPLKASAVLIIDEAQNLPLHVLEQIRILSNLETDKEKLLQIILVGQLNLQALLRSPDLRQLDQRISIRYELKALDQESTSAYVAHRLSIAGGSGSVAFTTKALALVHRITRGVPRLINLVCDRALLAGFSQKANRITPDMVRHAAEGLDIRPAMTRPFGWLKKRAALAAATLVVLFASAIAVGAAAWVYERYGVDTVLASAPATTAVDILLPAMPKTRDLPREATATVVAGSYAADETSGAVQSLTNWLEASGYHVYYASIDLGPAGRWQRVLAGAYTDPESAAVEADRLNRAAPGLDARAMSRAAATTGTDR